MRFEWTRLAGDLALRVHTPAKVNLVLDILGERPDGFHELDSIFQSVSIEDTLDCVDVSGAPGSPGERVGLEVLPGPDVERPVLPPTDDNLVLTAAARLRESVPAARDRGARLVLTKSIPMGAGLGGGSSDAAAALVALNGLWGLGLDRDELAAIGASLGSDVPYFLHGGLARCRGRGEEVTPLDDLEEPLDCVLVSPSLEVSTVLIYKQLRVLRAGGLTLTPSRHLHSMSEGLLVEGIRTGTVLSNHLQDVAFVLFPALRALYDALASESFVRVLMTGSGSTFLGLCNAPSHASEMSARLRERFSAAADQTGDDTGLGALGPIRVTPVRSVPSWTTDVPGRPGES